MTAEQGLEGIVSEQTLLKATKNTGESRDHPCPEVTWHVRKDYREN